MDENKGSGLQGRRSASRATRLRRRRKRMNLLLLAGFAALAALIILLSPKEPLRRASRTISTEDGVPDAGVRLVSRYDGLVFSELMSANHAAVTDENGEYPDWIEIWNRSGEPINMKGVGLSDRSDSIRFLFPDITLPADGRVLVFCSNTNQALPGSPFHAKFKLSSVGESVYLFDPNAYQIDSCAYPIMATDESWALTEDGFKAVTYFSPGYENTPEGHQAYRESIMASNGTLVINEIMADALTGLRDEDDELSDWVEIYNTSSAPANLDDYALSDNEGKPLKWRFPKGAVIPGHGYYVVFCSGKDKVEAGSGVPHTNFRISAETETIILTDSRGHVVDRVMIDNLPEDCSFGRNDEGGLQIFQVATPGLPNNQQGFYQMDTYLRALNPSGVYISEVLASNDSIATYPSAGFTDWIELYNSSTRTVDLSGYGLSDRLTRGRKWQFPKGTLIGAGEYKLVLCDGTKGSTDTAILHAGFKINRTDCETLALTDPAGRILDKVILPPQRTDISYGRTAGTAGFFYYDIPTPFRANGEGFRGYTEAPSFTVAPGMYFSTVYVEMKIPEGTQVYYTTDGSEPGTGSTAYHGERLEINFTTVIRARAFSADPQIRSSDILSGTWLINAYHTLPVFSLMTDPKNLWDPVNGMLADGNILKEAPGKLPFKNSTYRAVKNSGARFPVHVEMYETNGAQILNQDAQFSLMGDFSLDMPQKSMKFRAKSRYGSKTFPAALFPDREYPEYKSFVLRNSGNDSMWTRLQDGFESRLLDYCGATVIHQAWRPVAVYLNGVYWGHMNLRERVDKYFVAQHEGLTFDQADSIDILQASGTVKYGSNKAYKEMVKKIKAGNPAKNAEDLQYILDNVDVDNLFEYMAFEMFVGNSDIGNTRFYRLRGADSKWRWIWYDADYGLFNSGFNSPRSYTKEAGMGDQKIDNTIFRKLLSVPEYKDKFLRKMGEIFRKLTTRTMLSILEPLVEEITPEMELHWARWGEENDKMVLSEVPVTVDGAYRYWEKRVERLRNVCRKRPTYLWEMIEETFDLTDAQTVEYLGEKPEMPADAV